MSTIVSTAQGPNENGTTHSATVTVSGSDTAVFAFLKDDNNASPLSITCDGAAMTLVAELTSAFGGNERVYVRVGVPAGPRTVTVTNSVVTRPSLLAQARSGVNQTTPTRTPTTASLGFTTSFSQAVASQSGEDVLGFVTMLREAALFTPTAPTTTTLTQSFVDVAETRTVVTNTVATGASTTVAGTAAGGDGFIAFIGFAVQDAAGAPPIGDGRAVIRRAA